MITKVVHGKTAQGTKFTARPERFLTVPGQPVVWVLTVQGEEVRCDDFTILPEDSEADVRLKAIERVERCWEGARRP